MGVDSAQTIQKTDNEDNWKQFLRAMKDNRHDRILFYLKEYIKLKYEDFTSDERNQINQGCKMKVD